MSNVLPGHIQSVRHGAIQRPAEIYAIRINPDSRKLLTPDECRVLFRKIESMSTGGGETQISLVHRTSGAAKWVRSQMHVGSETGNIDLRVIRVIKGARASAATSRIDDAGLLEAIRSAEQSLLIGGESPELINDPFINESMLQPKLWSDTTIELGADARGDIARRIMEPAESQGLLSAGKFEIAAEGHATINSQGLFRYYPVTDVQCSVTVRNKKSTGSGWAGQQHYDLSKIDPVSLGNIAIDKCLRSADPYAVEPGRYVAILEPQAVSDLLSPILEVSQWENSGFIRPNAEMGIGPFAKSPGQSKIGEQVLDSRLTLRADPMDPAAGFVPFDQYSGDPFQAVNWIDRGYLRELSYDKIYALRIMGKAQSLQNSLSYRLSAEGPVISIEDMIQSTERGLLVTRFGSVQIVDPGSMLCSGFTRDGLWLIEKGKITRPVKNFRFTESPLFAFNSVEAIGAPSRVFSPPFARVVPAIKVRDFSFTSLADSV